MSSAATRRFRKWFVRTFWANHNDAPVIRQAIRDLLDDLADGRGLHLGCGGVRLDSRLVNLDLKIGGAADVCGDAQKLPFRDGTFALVVSQEMVEHLPDPFGAVREMARVLRKGGRVYLQAPFLIGYHPGPEDYWRFTRSGLVRLVEQAGMECLRLDLAVGPATGFYRVIVEFAAGSAARLVPFFYIPAKAFFSILMYPLKWFDRILRGGAQADRIAGGYFVIAVKP